MSEADPEAEATPGEAPPVNEEDVNAAVDPDDPMAGYKEEVPNS